MTVEALDATQAPVELKGWDKLADVTNSVLYIAILGFGLLTPPAFGLYATLFR